MASEGLTIVSKWLTIVFQRLTNQIVLKYNNWFPMAALNNEREVIVEVYFNALFRLIVWRSATIVRHQRRIVRRSDASVRHIKL